MVDRAVRYLSQNHSRQRITDQPGAVALIGLALLKSGQPATLPKIVEAVKVIEGPRLFAPDNYNAAVVIIFLCELGQKKHQPLIRRLVKKMIDRQRPDGSWSYRNYLVGDTSQTQYAAQAIWYAMNRGMEKLVPRKTVANMANWLLRTQDKTGSFGYHPRDPKSFTRLDQSRTLTSPTNIQTSPLD